MVLRKIPINKKHSSVQSRVSQGEGKRIISDVRPAHRSVSGAPRQPAEPAKLMRTQEVRQRPIPHRSERIIVQTSTSKNKKKIIFAVLIGSIVFIGVTFWRANLTITITPKETSFHLGSGVRMMMDAKLFNEGLVKRGEGTSLQIENFSKKSSGTIIVYNNFSSEDQILVKNTRFQSPDGLIYRAIDRVVVPGKDGSTQGSIEIIVEADEPGARFNIGLTDFTIPGFVGGPKFEGFYGRSKTPMTGGAVGQGRVVGDEEAEALLKKIEGEAQKELREQLTMSIPESFLVFQNEIETEILSKTTDPAIGSPAEKFFGEVRVEARTLGIDRDVYSELLAKILFKDEFKEGTQKLLDDSSIAFQSVSFDYENAQVTLVVEGEARFESIIDKDSLTKAVLEAQKTSDLKDIFNKNEAIQKAESLFRPAFWKKIPKSQKRLIIDVK